MELWDAYLSDGTLAGVDLTRGEPVPQGLYHLVCEVLVRHIDGSYLLMRRSPSKPNWGGYFEATAGGSALKDENDLLCAQRELKEETGIEASQFEPISQSISEDTIYHNFLCVTNCSKASVTLQEGETTAYQWVTEAAFMAFVNSDSIIPAQKARYLDYFVKMGYVFQ